MLRVHCAHLRHTPAWWCLCHLVPARTCSTLPVRPEFTSRTPPSILRIYKLLSFLCGHRSARTGGLEPGAGCQSKLDIGFSRRAASPARLPTECRDTVRE
eukprot:scaffold60453_cov55-Phaeocystis_antarctica.AAC.4